MRTTLALFILLASTSITAVAQAPSPDVSTALTMPKMLSLAPLPRAQFIREWDGLRDAELARIARTDATDARLRLAFRHAQGRVMYPFFHWRETEAATIETDPGLASVLSRLPAIDARLWEFREVRGYLDARLHERARQRLASDPDLGRGDARSPPAESVRKINDAIEADRAHLRGVRSLRYREVGGTPLYLHVLEPAQSGATPRPAMLWLHGGLGIDTGRIGVAGFSSGGSLALLLATRGSAPAAMRSGLSPRFPRPPPPSSAAHARLR